MTIGSDAQGLAQVGTPAPTTESADATALRAEFEQGRLALVGLLSSPGRGGVVLARRHAAMADTLLRKLFHATGCDRSRNRLALTAVGGYGRGLLGLGSDLDVCFVTDGQPEEVAEHVEAVLYPLWDAGISIGHQTIRVDDAVGDARRELAMATELLDARTLAGDSQLLASAQKRLSNELFVGDQVDQFVHQLEVQARERHEQFGDSVYLLEPDVKSGTGGLRDLDFALWAARARFGTNNLERLAKLSVLRPDQLTATEQALDFLWTVRNHLHHMAGNRRHDRLAFAEQEQVAGAMGYADGADQGAPELQRTGQMVESFMSDYYRHARVVAQARDRLLGRAKRRPNGSQPPALRIDGRYVVCEGRLGLADPDDLLADPALALSVYVEAVKRDMAVLSRTRDAIATATSDEATCQVIRDSPEAGKLFAGLACASHRAQFPSGSVLSELHDVGLLLAMVPEFAPVVGRVHHDLYHVYTVDVHSIAAVDRLHAIKRAELATVFPLATRLSAELARPRVLVLATLLHDVGKAIGGRDHAERGAVMARTILARFGLPEEEVEAAARLIFHHLAMYVFAIRRDLSDPATIEEFAQRLPGREALRELYLLTVADLSTTSPTSMTKWKRSMLDELFRASESFMAAGQQPAWARVAQIQAEAREMWPEGEQGDFEQFLRSMPERYFLGSAPEEIVAHAKLALAPPRSSIEVSVVPSTHAGVVGLCVVSGTRPTTELRVVAGDRPGLLAAISATIMANRLSTHAAQIYSRRLPNGEQQAVDVFWVRGDPEDPDVQARLSKIRRDLANIADGSLEVGQLLRPSSRPSWDLRHRPPVSTEVMFDHHGSATHTIVEVIAEDGPALLFTLTRALHLAKLSIKVAKISTEGTRAIDVFYVVEQDGSKLQPGSRTTEVRTAIQSALTAGE